MRRLWFPVLLGVLGVAVLVALGTWQLRRLAWKEGILASIDARIAAAPVPLPDAPEPGRDRYLPVAVTGALGGEELRVLTSLRDLGPGHRIVSVLTAGDRRVLVDLGYVADGGPDRGLNGGGLNGGGLNGGDLGGGDLDGGALRVADRVEVTGNLQWPDEADGWTPAPDGALWFARDVPAMAAALGAEPLLVVAREVSPDLGTLLLPVTSAGVPNDHRSYAITWFALAVVWALMGALLVRRTLRAA